MRAGGGEAKKCRYEGRHGETLELQHKAGNKAGAYSMGRGGASKGGGVYSFVACLSNLTIDYASLSRRSTVHSYSQ